MKLQQKKLFHGVQDFEITDEDHLIVGYKAGQSEQSFILNLAELDPKYGRVKRTSHIFGILAYLLGGATLLGATAGLLGDRSEDTLAALPGLGVMFVIALFLYRHHLRKRVDILAFYGRFNGQLLVSLWHNKPDPAAFKNFVDALVLRIKKAIDNPAPVASSDSISGEIRALKQLVVDGLISETEFEQGKKKLLSTADGKSPIGFGA